MVALLRSFDVTQKPAARCPQALDHRVHDDVGQSPEEAGDQSNHKRDLSAHLSPFGLYPTTKRSENQVVKKLVMTPTTIITPMMNLAQSCPLRLGSKEGIEYNPQILGFDPHPGVFNLHL